MTAKFGQLGSFRHPWRFAAASGAMPALIGTRWRLDIGSVDPAVLTRLDAQARAKSQGYSPNIKPAVQPI